MIILWTGDPPKNSFNVHRFSLELRLHHAGAGLFVKVTTCDQGDHMCQTQGTRKNKKERT